jgi:cytochrome c5
VSKQDTHFINVFSVIIGLLVAVALILFALARIIANRTQVVEVHSDPAYVAEVDANTRPVARVAVAGQDNTALAIAAPAAAAAAPALVVPKNGAELYEAACKACHGAGIAGAPKTGDKAAWAPRLAQGKAVLYEHALKGFTGKTGTMPAKGARTDLSDDLIKQGVDYLTSLAQ